jgi:hypothetical protein
MQLECKDAPLLLIGNPYIGCLLCIRTNITITHRDNNNSGSCELPKMISQQYHNRCVTIFEDIHQVAAVTDNSWIWYTIFLGQWSAQMSYISKCKVNNRM